MGLFNFLSECYGHIISCSPSIKLFSTLRFYYYGPKLKKVTGRFFSSTQFWIERPENVIIGNNVFFNRNVFIACVDVPESEIVISDNCQFGPNVVIVAGDHPYLNKDLQIRFQDTTPGKIFIGKDCWVGSNVTITKDVTIGEGAVIGANSVVTRDIPPYTIAVGAPARVINTRK